MASGSSGWKTYSMSWRGPEWGRPSASGPWIQSGRSLPTLRVRYPLYPSAARGEHTAPSTVARRDGQTVAVPDARKFE